MCSRISVFQAIISVEEQLANRWPYFIGIFRGRLSGAPSLQAYISWFSLLYRNILLDKARYFHIYNQVGPKIGGTSKVPWILPRLTAILPTTILIIIIIIIMIIMIISIIIIISSSSSISSSISISMIMIIIIIIIICIIIMVFISLVLVLLLSLQAALFQAAGHSTQSGGPLVWASPLRKGAA